MKFCKQIAGIFLAVLAILTLPFYTALAAGGIDLSRACSLTVSCQDGGAPLIGAEFCAYLAATVDENGELTPTEDFSRFRVDIRGENDEAWKTLAITLEGYVLQEDIAPVDSGITDEQGKLSLPTGENKLTPGLYLVLGGQHKQNGLIYDIQPFVVLLPALNKETNDWNYDVEVSPKYESRPEPSEPEDTVACKVLKVWEDEGHENERPKEITVQLLRDGTVYDTVALNAENNWRYTWEDLESNCEWMITEKTPEGYTVAIAQEGITFIVTNTWDEPGNPPTEPAPTDPVPTPSSPDDPKLPNTGQLWWPVPILICAGLILIAVGLIRRRGAASDEE